MVSWPILSVVTFLPLVGALFCLVVTARRRRSTATAAVPP
jgi:NADH:ubiquinone oxidoreductase subunit 4 (subunit M)